MDLSRIFFREYHLRMAVLERLTTFCTKVKMRATGIKYGVSCRFWGVPTICLFPGSTVLLGDRVRMRSALQSNLIGMNHGCIISTHGKESIVRIGNDSGLSGTSIGCLGRIEIGRRTLIGANSLITDFDWHNLKDLGNSDLTSRPVSIGNDVFIGYSCTILKGVTIGDNTIIGANSVVVSSIPANCIAAGNPCTVKSQRAELPHGVE